MKGYGVQVDVYLMQNFQHLEHLLDHCNLLPVAPRDTDINRIRFWYLEGLAKRFRQLVLFSSFPVAEVTRLFRVHSTNAFGSVGTVLDSEEGRLVGSSSSTHPRG